MPGRRHAGCVRCRSGHWPRRSPRCWTSGEQQGKISRPKQTGVVVCQRHDIRAPIAMIHDRGDMRTLRGRRFVTQGIMPLRVNVSPSCSAVTCKGSRPERNFIAFESPVAPARLPDRSSGSSSSPRAALDSGADIRYRSGAPRARRRRSGIVARQLKPPRPHRRCRRHCRRGWLGTPAAANPAPARCGRTAEADSAPVSSPSVTRASQASNAVLERPPATLPSVSLILPPKGCSASTDSGRAVR